MPHDILYLGEQIDALLHNLTIDLDTTLFGRLCAGCFLYGCRGGSSLYGSLRYILTLTQLSVEIRLGLRSSSTSSAIISILYHSDLTSLSFYISHRFTFSFCSTGCKLCLGELLLTGSLGFLSSLSLLRFKLGLSISLLLFLDLLLSKKVRLVTLLLLGLDPLLNFFLSFLLSTLTGCRFFSFFLALKGTIYIVLKLKLDSVW